MKLVEIGEYSRVQIETYQNSNGKQHPLYGQVLSELLQVYESLQNQEKITEINIINGLKIKQK